MALTFDLNKKSAGKRLGIENVPFSVSAKVVPRKINIIGTYDPGKTEIVPDEPLRVFSPDEVGSKCGFGTMLHRLAVRAYDGSRGVETFITPQEEVGGAVAGSGNIDFVGSTVTKASKLHFYAAAIKTSGAISLAVGDDEDAIAVKFAAAVEDAANKAFPVSAAVDDVTTSQVNITAKSKGPWGNFITLAFNIQPGEKLPEGVQVAITDMTGGSGVPDVTPALNAWGVDDNQNEEWYMDVICGYGQDTDTWDKLHDYNGNSNEGTGNYKPGLMRAFRTMVGDTDPGTAALSALIAKADLRAEFDMTNGIVAEPGSYHHPMELAAVSMGLMSYTNNTLAESGYVDLALPNIIPSPKTDRWTDNEDNRELAVRNGISVTQVKNNRVTLQNMMSFWRPESLPLDNNAYRSMRNISLLQNIAYSGIQRFDTEKWKRFTVVRRTQRVTNPNSQTKARDTNNVREELVGWTYDLEKNAWIYEADFTIEKLKEGNVIFLREDGSGWNYRLPFILSGEGGILDGIVQVDINLAILAN